MKNFEQILNQYSDLCLIGGINQYSNILLDKNRIIKLAKVLNNKNELLDNMPVNNFSCMKDGILQNFTVYAKKKRSVEYFIRLIIATQYGYFDYELTQKFISIF